MISLSLMLTRITAFVVSALLAHAAVARAAPGEVPAGSHPALVILVQFGDESGHTTAAQWRHRFFGADESVRQHYHDGSDGALDIAAAAERHGTADDGVVGWLTLGAANAQAAAAGGAAQLARDAMTAASRHVDFARFDTDGDGRLSAAELLIVIVVAGHGAPLPSACGPSEWSHPAAIEPLPVGGVHLSPYAMVAENECEAPVALETITQQIDRLLGAAADVAAASDSPQPPLATLTLTTPDGGEAWHFGSRRRIEWTSTALTGRVRLELSRDAGATWTTIVASTANDGAFHWTVTPPRTNRARVRVCSVAIPSLCDASDRNFRIGVAALTVVAPNGGERWALNTTQQIQWTSAGPVGSDVSIEVSRDSGATWTTIVASVANDGAQNWTVTGPLGPSARIRVCSVAVPSVCDRSDGDFRIVRGVHTVLTPNGGESWDIGSTQRIEWTSSGAVGSDVRVELRRGPGGAWEPLFASIANDGAQNWTVTGPATARARVRVCSATAAICDVSNANFTISDGTVRVLAPNGGEAWPIGGTRRIEWRSSASGNVRVEVSRNGGTSWTPIFASIANDGTQNWAVTGPATSTARIRVCHVDAPSVCDTSDAVFAIGEGAANLTARLLSFTPTDLLGGQAWLVRVQTANDGVAAAGPSRTDIYIGTTSATGTIRITELSFTVPALAPGAVSDQTDTIAFPFTVPPGTYFVFARVDAAGAVPESSEANEFVLLTPTLLVH